jgi:signal transduction histidine kinase/DNA-binding response OmpR family regulator
MSKEEDVSALRARIGELETENALLRRDFGAIGKGVMVKVPEAIKPLFDVAQSAVSEYFRHLKMDPTQGTIEINDQRYVLVRASALSKDFLDTIRHLYADRGESEAISIGKNFLFDISHVIGMNDARAFHQKMNFTDPLSKLSAGPIHFAYSGWAFVEILPDSNPTPDESFYLHYSHPYSFEADSWLRSGARSETPVCIMNAGYSSGWCEESFGIPLTSVEVSCRAKGDAHCTFIMSPPNRIEARLEHFKQAHTAGFTNGGSYEIPTFFERKKVEEEMQRARLLAEESVKTKADFLANISHELRTPLGAILGFTELLEKTTLSVVQQEYLEAIHTSGNNLLSIINDILDLSKLDAGQFAIESIPFSITEVMHSIEAMFAAKAAGKSVTLTSTTDPALSGYVLGDPMRLTQILTNLVGNAIKFTEQGSIRLHCRLERESAGRIFVIFSVKDTGIGIPEHMADRIFERFTQADTDITRRYGGTGLGLAITRQLVALQGGTISLDTSLGKGTTFYVGLSYPVAAAASGPTEERSLQLPAYGSAKSILLTEDNYMVRKLTEIMLTQAGFRTVIAEHGGAAVELLRSQPFDLVLMDIQMPVMDGYKATRIIRDELGLSTPIIAMTAHALAGEKELCIQKGMNDYISKPFKEEELLEKITYWLGRTAPPKGIIDLSFLRQQTYNNKKFILEMIGYFRKHNPEDVAHLEAAIAAAEYDVIYKTTHRLRNTIIFFGLQKIIGPALERMEHLASGNTGLDEIAALFREIKPVFTQALRELADPDPGLFR